MKTKKDRKYHCPDKTDEVVYRLVEKANSIPSRYSGPFFDENRNGAKLRDELLMQFPVITSIKDKFSGFKDIRRRMKDASAIYEGYRGGIGCLEISIKDMLATGHCMIYGRNFVLPECGIGVHDVCWPEYSDKQGNSISEEVREMNRKKAKRIIGSNGNGSATSKAMAAHVCLKLGIRCRLVAGGVAIVDNWPDYDDDRKVLSDNSCGYSYS